MYTLAQHNYILYQAALATKINIAPANIDQIHSKMHVCNVQFSGTTGKTLNEDFYTQRKHKTMDDSLQDKIPQTQYVHVYMY